MVLFPQGLEDHPTCSEASASIRAMVNWEWSTDGQEPTYIVQWEFRVPKMGGDTERTEGPQDVDSEAEVMNYWLSECNR